MASVSVLWCRQALGHLSHPSIAVCGDDLTTAARAVHAFLMDERSDLRRFVSAASDGGVFFSSGVHCQTAGAAVRFRHEDVLAPAGISVDQFVLAARGYWATPRGYWGAA